MKKKILIVVILLLVVILAISAWKVWEIASEYIKGAKVYSRVESYVSIPEKLLQPDAPKPDPNMEMEPVEEGPLFPEVDFEALWEQNPDVVGWIYIPDTKINYPILQGKDNDQYLKRMIDGKYNSAGSIFLEAGIPKNFSSQNNPIYGHRMKNGTMFAGIAKYTSQAYYDEHPVAYLVTPEKNYIVHLFSGRVVSVWGNTWDTSFTEDGFADWLDEACRKSYFSSKAVPTTNDHILTFSTCTYEREDVRFVVHGIMEEYIP